jgi:hypothetical protein
MVIKITKRIIEAVRMIFISLENPFEITLSGNKVHLTYFRAQVAQRRDQQRPTSSSEHGEIIFDQVSLII